MELTIHKDLSPEELALAKELLPEMYNTETVGPTPVVLDWEQEMKDDLATGQGFIVRSKPFKKKMTDKNGEVMTKGVKEMWGTHSPLFGTDWQDENAFADRYSCECGNMIGRVFKGRRCPKCGKKVEFVDVDLTVRSICG